MKEKTATPVELTTDQYNRLKEIAKGLGVKVVGRKKEDLVKDFLNACDKMSPEEEKELPQETVDLFNEIVKKVKEAAEPVQKPAKAATKKAKATAKLREKGDTPYAVGSKYEFVYKLLKTGTRFEDLVKSISKKYGETTAKPANVRLFIYTIKKTGKNISTSKDGIISVK